MRAKVLKTFRDKYTKELYKKDDIIEVSKARAAEMNAALAAPLVEIIVEKKTKRTKKKGG